jgi:hypothetical protein
MEEISCLICGTTNPPIIRDHNHITKMIRGPLCNLCNAYLGIYENRKQSKLKNKNARIRFDTWVTRYKNKIEEHLKRNTGILYRSRPEYFKVKMKTA